MTTQLGAEAIKEAAIELFAARGVDGVSLSDIHKASGHRNRSAIAYHFGTKDVLIEELIAEIVEAHDRRRTELLDQLAELDAEPSLEDILRAAVAPMIDDLKTRPNRLRLRMLANLAADDRYMDVIQRLMSTHDGLGRSTAAIASHLGDLPEVIRTERIVVATTFGLRVFADHARLIDNPNPDRTLLAVETFSNHIVELLEALLTAPHRPSS